jgi:lysophospholipid acyltransferase (LPLAT)-like uncharacterized protein
MLKRLKYAIMLNLLPPVTYLFLLILKATIKIEHANREAIEPFWQRGESYLACFWHGRLLAMPFAYGGHRGKVLISRHADGEFIARVISYFGIGAVRGSAGKEGAVSSVREMIAELAAGTNIGITPDGPKGPRHRVKEGIIELARMSGRPIVPMTYAASKKKVFKSWDGFVLPYPFSTILYVWGDPIYVPRGTRGEALEKERLNLERGLIALTEEADRMVCSG